MLDEAYLLLSYSFLFQKHGINYNMAWPQAMWNLQVHTNWGSYESGVSLRTDTPDDAAGAKGVCRKAT